MDSVVSRETRSVFPDDGLDLSENGRRASVDRVIRRIFRHEPDLRALLFKSLDGCGVLKQRYDDLTVFRVLLRTDDDLVPIENACADHGISAHAERKAAAFAVPRDVALNVLHGKDGDTGRNHANHGNAVGTVCVGKRDGALFHIVHLDEAAFAQCVEVVMDGRSGLQADGGTDLAHRGCIMILLNELCDKVVVTDISGKQLLFAEQVESVDVSMLSSGIYFVTMQLGDQVNTTQVIKR